MRLIIFQVDAHIADMWHGKQNRLSAIRRVGDDFLIAGHAGIKDQFKNRFSFCAESRPGINRAVFEHKDCCVIFEFITLSDIKKRPPAEPSARG
jgi:hypothetical protein